MLTRNLATRPQSLRLDAVDELWRNAERSQTLLDRGAVFSDLKEVRGRHRRSAISVGWNCGYPISKWDGKGKGTPSGAPNGLESLSVLTIRQKAPAIRFGQNASVINAKSAIREFGGIAGREKKVAG